MPITTNQPRSGQVTARRPGSWGALLGVAALPLLVACGASDPSRPNVVIIDIDSLRADRLSAQRDGEPIAPTLAALAGQGVVFEHHIAQGGWTMPSLASLLSGRYPVALREQTSKLSWLPGGASVLPQILGDRGYHTAFYAGSTLVYSATVGGMFQDVIAPPERDDERLVTPMAQWVEHEAREPFFALLHDMDLHSADHRLPASAVCRWAADAERCAELADQQLPVVYDTLAPLVGPELAQAQVIAQYDGTLAAYDQALGALFAALERRGVRERTIVVLSSDHGEELGEHGFYGHGVLYDTVLRIPLVVADPWRDPGGRVATVTQTVDIAPTLLDRLGLPGAGSMDGRSLLPLMDGRAAEEGQRPVFSLSDRFIASVRTADSKLWMTSCPPHKHCRELDAALPAGDRARVVQYFRLDVDPGEREDLAMREAQATVVALGQLDAWLGTRVQEASDAGYDQLPPDPVLLERLRQDGYWTHVSE